MQITHNDLIEFQYNSLERLASGDEVIALASDSRKFLKEVYVGDSGIPNGAEIGINVNNKCNLKCGHCYYAGTHLFQEEEKDSLNEEEWKRVIDESVITGMNHINIIGKEPLLAPHKTRAILNTIRDYRIKGHEIRYEIITNGILIKQEIKWLRQYPDFYFFSISFDGYEKQHDMIRGNGNYQRSREGLRIAHEQGIKNLSATFCAMPHNVKSLNQMLDDLIHCGLEYLSIGLCFPTEYNNKCLYSGMSVFNEVVSEVKSAPKSLDISISLMGDEHGLLIAELFKKGFLEKRNLAVSEDYAPALILPINISPRTAVHLSILPVMFLSGYRIDYDGTAIDFCADLQGQVRRGFGNARQNSVSNLYKRSREELWPKYTEQFYRRLNDAFQGEQSKPLKPVYS